MFALGVPVVIVVNKIDRLKPGHVVTQMKAAAALGPFHALHPVSALSNDGIEELRNDLISLLPEGPMYYPADQISDQQERTIAAEMIREKLIVLTEEELPHSTAVVIDRFEEEGNLYRIYASIYVERDSQKGIVIGKGGEKLKEVGTAARKEMESFFDRKIFLELHVKVKKNWRDDPETLRSLGLGE